MSEDFKTALKVYKRLKSEFSNSDEAQDIDALISFCEAKMNN